MNNKKTSKRFISKVLLMLMIINSFSTVALASDNKKVTTAKPLVILMEFPDYKFSDIDEKETKRDRVHGVKGEDFTKAYVNDWLFAENKFTSVDKEGTNRQVISTRQSLSQMTNGTYDFNGEVVGPYTAKKNAKYYGADGQTNVRYLIQEAIEAVSKDENIDLSEFDVETRVRDIDNSETIITYGKPDGQVDTLIVIHPGIGNEWYGGSLNVGDTGAIHPFRRGFTWYAEEGWYLEEYKTKDHMGKEWRFDDFLIVAQDGAADIVLHEFGHILGLPDLYAPNNGQPPVQYWDVMGGSYTGQYILGDGPISYGGYSRYYLHEAFKRGDASHVNWANFEEYDLEDINGQEIELNRSSKKKDGVTDLIKINLPDQDTKIVDLLGETAFFTGVGNRLKNSMKIKNIDLMNCEDALLTFDAWYKIDPGYDFVTIRVNETGSEEWESVEGNITVEGVDPDLKKYETEEERKLRNPGYGVTGYSDGWVDAEFDLSKYVGKKIDLEFYFYTDGNTPEDGMYFDNISIVGNTSTEKVEVKEEIILDEKVEVDLENDEINPEELEIESENIEAEVEVKEVKEEKIISEKSLEKILDVKSSDGKNSDIEFKGFDISDGSLKHSRYYLIEWRKGDLGEIDGAHAQLSPSQELTYEPGMLMWYINESCVDDRGKPDQNSNYHPGSVYAGVIDADQTPAEYIYNGEYSIDKRVDYMLHDATFSLKEEQIFNKKWSNGSITDDRYRFMVPDFNDEKDYSNSLGNDEAGLILEELGFKVLVLEEKADRSGGKIKLINKNNPEKINILDSDLKLNLIGTDFINNEEIILEANNNGYLDNMGENAYINYVNKKTKDELKIKLNFDGQSYKGKLDMENSIANGDYEVSYVILEDKEGNAKAIYNSNHHEGYGRDLSDSDIKIGIKERVKINSLGLESNNIAGKDLFEKGDRITVNTSIKTLHKVEEAIVVVEAVDSDGVPYAVRTSKYTDNSEYSLAFNTADAKKGTNKVNVYVWNNLNDKEAVAEKMTYEFELK